MCTLMLSVASPNFCLHFTRPGSYSISQLVLAGKQKEYDYPTFSHLLLYNSGEKKVLSHNLPTYMLDSWLNE